MKYHKSRFLCDFSVLTMKGLISENAQGVSPSTLLYFEYVALSYKKQQRKKLYPPKQGSTPWLPDYHPHVALHKDTRATCDKFPLI